MKGTRLERIDEWLFTTLDKDFQAQMVGGQTTYVGTGPVTDPLPHRHGDRADTATDVS